MVTALPRRGCPTPPPRLPADDATVRVEPWAPSARRRRSRLRRLQQRYDQELARLQAERKAKVGQVLLPLLLQLLLFVVTSAATKVAVEQTATAGVKEAIQKSLGKKRLSAVAAFTKNPGVRDEAALEEQRRLEAKTSSFLAEGQSHQWSKHFTDGGLQAPRGAR